MKAAVFLALALSASLGAPALASHHEHGAHQKSGHGESASPREMMKQHHPVRGPLAKGLEAFHDTLHVLVHDLMPKGDMAAVKAKVPELKKKAAALKAVNLPPAARKQRTRRDELVKAVDDLEAASGGDDKTFQAAFEDVHRSFEELAMASRPGRGARHHD